MVTADAQITKIEVHVERAPMAAALSGDVTGRVPLKVKMGAHVVNKVRIERAVEMVYSRISISRASRGYENCCEKCGVYKYREVLKNENWFEN